MIASQSCLLIQAPSDKNQRKNNDIQYFNIHNGCFYRTPIIRNLSIRFWWGLVVGVVAEDSAVGVEDFGFGDEADVATVLDYGEIPCAGAVE